MDLPSLEGDITTVEAALVRMRTAPPGSVSATMWQDAVDVLDQCREELVVAEAQIRFHRLEAAGWRAGEYRTSPWTARVLDRLPVPVMSLTDTGCIVYANQAASRMLGLESGRFIGKPLVVHVDLDHRMVYRRAWNRALAGEATGAGAEVVLRTAHGAASWRRLVIVPEDDGGRVRVMALPVEQPADAGIDGADVRVSRGIAAMAQLPLGDGDEKDLLARALGFAVAMPGVVAASYGEARPGGPAPLAGSSAAGLTVEALQHRHGEGPGRDAVALGRTVASDDMAGDTRWPTFGPGAARLGYHAVVAVPVAVAGDPATEPAQGVVTLWGPAVGSIPAGLVPLSGAIGEAVAAALGVRRRMTATIATATTGRADLTADHDLTGTP